MRRLLPLLLALLLVTAACGDDDDDGDDVASDDTAQPSEEPSEEPPSIAEPADDEYPVVDNETFIRFTALGLDSNTGVLEFGATADDVLERIHGTWGDPESDTG